MSAIASPGKRGLGKVHSKEQEENVFSPHLTETWGGVTEFVSGCGMLRGHRYVWGT